MRFDRIWLNARLATLVADNGLGIVENGAVATIDGRIAFVGFMSSLPSGWDAKERIDCEGRWITPGLVDCHTHLVFGGDRAHEFELRLNGASYEEIARAGGGIVSTVKATRAASENELVASALPRLDHLIREGVTTVEIKSGYGLDLESEARMLRAARQLGKVRPVSVTTTFLGAHALPPEESATLVHYLVKNERTNTSKAFEREVPGSARAELQYKVIGSSENYHLLGIRLITGRHHQIRCQLSFIGSPIKGDLKYGFARSNPDGSIHLHSYSLDFIHPVKNERLSLRAWPLQSDPVWNFFKGRPVPDF